MKSFREDRIPSEEWDLHDARETRRCYDMVESNGGNLSEKNMKHLVRTCNNLSELADTLEPNNPEAADILNMSIRLLNEIISEATTVRGVGAGAGGGSG